MRNHDIIVATLCVLPILAIAGCVGPISGTSIKPSERLAELSTSAAASSQSAALSRDICVNAVRNAVAVCNQKEELLLEALRGSKAVDISRFREEIEQATENTLEAYDACQKAVALENEISVVCTSIRTRSTDAGKLADGGQQLKAIERLQEDLKQARKRLKECEAVAEAMKQRWLIPPKLQTGTRPGNVNGGDSAGDQNGGVSEHSR